MQAMELVFQYPGVPTYETGHGVTGIFRVPAKQALKASDLTLSLAGVSEVKWLPTESAVSQIFPSVVLHETQKFFELVKDVDDKELLEVNDTKEVAFVFKLPLEGIPSTYTSPDGWIHYHVVAIVKRPDRNEERIDREIKVLAPFRQNLKVIVHVSLARKGWVPGETMKVNCDIINKSSGEVTPRATLYQTKVYLFGERHKATQTAITDRVVGNRVDKHNNNDQDLMVAIPDSIPLSIKSDLITIKYHIHVTMDIPHGPDFYADLPIVITTRSAINLQE